MALRHVNRKARRKEVKEGKWGEEALGVLMAYLGLPMLNEWNYLEIPLSLSSITYL